MFNYLNIFCVWDIVEKRYIPRFDDNTKKITIESKIDKKFKDYVANVILNSVNVSNRFLFDDMTSVNDKWCALINAYESNNQVEIEVNDSHSELEDEQE
jgi:hypothetical protein